ncbi:hypothetical protein ANANG_G00200250 [Anguilla anguilla]|uniref:Uncharacterized protein n=1 Tax=Anguilla anguilla TaxID=7936 RepID=A0A9D3M4I0_ANGAN|nr:hypothetical protein ANANG_G00200250 [Anguilla anguilla]
MTDRSFILQKNGWRLGYKPRPVCDHFRGSVPELFVHSSWVFSPSCAGSRFSDLHVILPANPCQRLTIYNFLPLQSILRPDGDVVKRVVSLNPDL